MNKVGVLLHVFSKVFVYMPVCVYVGTFVFELVYHGIRKFFPNKLSPMMEWVTSGVIVMVLVFILTHQQAFLVFQTALGLVGYYLGTKITDKTLSLGVILLTLLLFVVSYVI
jgi:hypothetical protein